jgi:hypothetical protein
MRLRSGIAFCGGRRHHGEVDRKCLIVGNVCPQLRVGFTCLWNFYTVAPSARKSLK